MEKKKLAYLQIHPKDNVLVALRDLPAGYEVDFEGRQFSLIEAVAAKHKFTISDMHKDDEVFMYGVLVGRVNYDLSTGSVINVDNLRHASDDFRMGKRNLSWSKPDVSMYKDKTFLGFHRSNGKVGTANHWLVIPLVFCEAAT